MTMKKIVIALAMLSAANTGWLMSGAADVKKVIGGAVSEAERAFAATKEARERLFYAVVASNEPLVKELLMKGVDPSIPVISAAWVPSDQTVKATAKDKDGKVEMWFTPLMYAKTIPIARLLLQYGAAKTINEGDGRDGSTALYWAVRMRTPELVELLLENGASIYTPNMYGTTVEDITVGRYKDSYLKAPNDTAAVVRRYLDNKK